MHFRFNILLSYLQNFKIFIYHSSNVCKVKQNVIVKIEISI